MHVLYCGDTSLSGAAAYLAGLIHHAGWTFRYVASNVPITADVLLQPFDLLVLSDYPSIRIDPEQQQVLCDRVRAGAGLLMVGGWESFAGSGGHWRGTLLADLLPVDIATSDDRVNFSQSAYVEVVASHPVVNNLPWQHVPPAIGGLNRVTVRAPGTVLLQARQFAVAHATGGDWTLTPVKTYPLLVVGTAGQGRTAAIMTDVAPHWVGGLVDWGPHRVSAQAPQSEEIEVGSDYAAFWTNLLAWAGNV